MRIFKEEQRFNQLWLIILIIISTMMPIGIIIGTYIKNPKSFSSIELVLLIGLILFASGFIFLFKLSTRIDEKGIHYKFFPFHWSYKITAWHDINKAYIRKYDALSEYGGWGFKGGKLWNKSKGKAINVSGDIGIQLELKNGKKLLIGTQKKNEVESVLATYKTKINHDG
ncbi:hypothetical protein H8K90_11800 [Winogradskyella echinorum]|uniref:PH domain-containing protein n=1 Tax=Winogradskyella echinorum TaxID=538189 RepID=A0ABR6Y489_9FLAO|nr:hypothetical protein [Winogradskyella echinorum]MBC3847068.1 hypothetical protein [Winogradskyella echinorum]MBC5751416.1 hypothetical protein [Winogradskyella echinorum]